MYNPEELKLEQGNQFAEVGIPGLNASPLQYVRGKNRVLTMELFFDTYESGEDVRAHTAPIVALLNTRPQTLAPPVLLFSLGRVQFRCVLTDAGQRFTMFDRDGTPVRSTMSVRLQEYVDVSLEVRQGLFLGSPTASAVVNTVVAPTVATALGAGVRGRRGSRARRAPERHPQRHRRHLPGGPGAVAGDRPGQRDRRPVRARDRGVAGHSDRNRGPRRTGADAMSAPPFAPRFEVRLSGVTLAADLADNVLSLTVETDLDLAGSFSLTLRNPDNRLLDSALLDIGKTVEIHLGYGPDLVPAFLGEVASIEPSFPADGPPTIAVSGYDKSYRLRHAQQRPRQHDTINDSIIAAQIAAENGLVPVVDPAPFIAERIQVETDMAFLKACADQYFFDVYVEWDRLHFHFPRPQLAAYTLEWGKNLSSFSPRISAAGLAGVQEIRVYNQELAQAITVTILAASLDVETLVERLGSSAMQLLMSFVRKGIRQEAIENPVQAAAAGQRRSCGICWRACTRAPGRASGSPTWRPGST